MMKIVFPGNDLDQLTRQLLASREESCALLTATFVPRLGRILIRDMYIVPAEKYSVRSSSEAQIRAEYLVPIVAAAREKQQCVIAVHTHPGAKGQPRFSAIDDAAEQTLQRFLRNRIPDRPHAAIVFSPGSHNARILGTRDRADLLEIGAIVRSYAAEFDNQAAGPRFDRQIRAFGRDGQRRLAGLKIAIVGLGGTGSVVSQQLAYLGVKRLLLFDPDNVDESNLNRVVGAGQHDVGKRKVAAAARLASELGASVETCDVDVTDTSVAAALAAADAIFCCTDTHASRAILNQIAYQYYIPLFDMGVSIRVDRGRIMNMAGRVQMASPGLACLVCTQVIDANAVRTDLMSPLQRAADPYFTGHHEPQPAVISLNSTVASLAVTMFMAAFLDVPAKARLQYYNGIAGTVRSAEARADASCVVCSKSGALGSGDEWPLLGRSSTA